MRKGDLKVLRKRFIFRLVNGNEIHHWLFVVVGRDFDGRHHGVILTPPTSKLNALLKKSKSIEFWQDKRVLKMNKVTRHRKMPIKLEFKEVTCLKKCC